MKKVLRILLIIFAVIGVAIAGILGFVQIKGIPSYKVEAPDMNVTVTAEKVSQGANLSLMLCGHCHMSENGVLEGTQMLDIEAVFGEIHAPNITQDPEHGIGSYSDGELAYLLRTGIKRDGQYAPPYMPKFPNMAQEDIEAIIAYLRSDHPDVQASQKPTVPCKPSLLTKALSNFAFKPHPYKENLSSKPSPENPVAYGEYLVNDQLHCYACHSEDITKTNELDPPLSAGYLGGGTVMIDGDGNEIITPNITFDKETGIGNYTPEQFISLVKFGRKPDGTSISLPMRPYTPLDTASILSIYEYLKSVPPVKNEKLVVENATINQR